jgi:hypothetical protein
MIPPMRDLSRYDLGEMGLRALSGRRLGFAHRRAGFVVLASDLDEDSHVAAVWLVRRPGSPDSAQHILQFERAQGWRYLGAGSSSAQELSLAGRPSVSVNGPMSIVRSRGGCAARSRTDREKQAEALGIAGAGWVSCEGFQLAVEVRHLQVGERLIPVPDHGYAVVAWRSPPAKTRPLIAAIGNDGSPLSELGPNDALDSLTWESVQGALLDEPLPEPRHPDTD